MSILWTIEPCDHDQGTRTKFDDVLLEHGVLRRVALLAPVVVLYYGA